MDPARRQALVAALVGRFGAATDVTPQDGQPLHVLLPEVALPTPWSPSPTEALTVWANWPAERPQLYVAEDVVGSAGEPPRSSETRYLIGRTWRQYSFSFGWRGDDPVRAVQLWLNRFAVEDT
jgi:hypothetical protein